jgi:hypothetical protein
MLQLIGWLGCIYLAVKALSFAASREYRTEAGHLTGYAALAIFLSWFAVIGFAIAFYIQGSAATDAFQTTSTPFDIQYSYPLADPAE